MSFHDSMIDEGFSDEQEYLDHLMSEFDRRQDNEYYDSNRYDDCEDEYYCDDDYLEDPFELEEGFAYMLRKFRKLCIENQIGAYQQFIEYHLQSDGVDGRNGTLYRDFFSTSFVNDFVYLGCSTPIREYDEVERPYLEWALNNKLENFFVGILYEEVGGFSEAEMEIGRVYNDYDKITENRLEFWRDWIELKYEYSQWLGKGGDYERCQFFKDINRKIRDHRGLLCSMMQYFVEMKSKMFMEECHLILKIIYSDLKRALRVYYKVFCIKEYGKPITEIDLSNI